MRLLRYAPSDSSTYFKYAYGVLGRKPCIHIRLHLLATNPCDKCGLSIIRGHLIEPLNDMLDLFLVRVPAQAETNSTHGNIRFYGHCLQDRRYCRPMQRT